MKTLNEAIAEHLMPKPPEPVTLELLQSTDSRIWVSIYSDVAGGYIWRAREFDHDSDCSMFLLRKMLEHYDVTLSSAPGPDGVVYVVITGHENVSNPYVPKLERAIAMNYAKLHKLQYDRETV